MTTLTTEPFGFLELRVLQSFNPNSGSCGHSHPRQVPGEVAAHHAEPVFSAAGGEEAEEEEDGMPGAEKLASPGQ